MAGNCTMFPKPKADDDPWFDDQDEAMAICNGISGGRVCPIRDQCLQFALVNNEFQGIWGGTQEHDRKRLRKKWPKSSWGSVTWEPPTPVPGAKQPDDVDLLPPSPPAS